MANWFLATEISELSLDVQQKWSQIFRMLFVTMLQSILTMIPLPTYLAVVQKHYGLAPFAMIPVPVWL